MTTVVFLHGVGGPTPGWDDALRGSIGIDGATGLTLVTQTVSFDDLINREGRIRRKPAPLLNRPIVDSHARARSRQLYYGRQQRLRAVAWNSEDRVLSPRFRQPYLIPGEVLIRLPILDMRQAGHYRHDDELRAEVLDRVCAAINAIDDDIVLFAHSLGSVVALDALHTRKIEAGLLVSFGSPLGIRHFWGRDWETSETFPYDRLGAWLNVINLHDPVPWKRGVTRRFPQAVDAYIDIGDGFAGPHNYHDASTYASSGTVAAVVVDYLRRDRAADAITPVDDVSGNL